MPPSLPPRRQSGPTAELLGLSLALSLACQFTTFQESVRSDSLELSRSSLACARAVVETSDRLSHVESTLSILTARLEAIEEGQGVIRDAIGTLTDCLAFVATESAETRAEARDALRTSNRAEALSSALASLAQDLTTHVRKLQKTLRAVVKREAQRESPSPMEAGAATRAEAEAEAPHPEAVGVAEGSSRDPAGVVDAPEPEPGHEPEPGPALPSILESGLASAALSEIDPSSLRPAAPPAGPEPVPSEAQAQAQAASSASDRPAEILVQCHSTSSTGNESASASDPQPTRAAGKGQGTAALGPSPPPGRLMEVLRAHSEDRAARNDLPSSEPAGSGHLGAAGDKYLPDPPLQLPSASEYYTYSYDAAPGPTATPVLPPTNPHGPYHPYHPRPFEQPQAPLNTRYWTPPARPWERSAPAQAQAQGPVQVGQSRPPGPPAAPGRMAGPGSFPAEAPRVGGPISAIFCALPAGAFESSEDEEGTGTGSGGRREMEMEERRRSAPGLSSPPYLMASASPTIIRRGAMLAKQLHSPDP